MISVRLRVWRASFEAAQFNLYQVVQTGVAP
jgi:hypothetical protein